MLSTRGQGGGARSGGVNVPAISDAPSNGAVSASSRSKGQIRAQPNGVRLAHGLRGASDCATKVEGENIEPPRLQRAAARLTGGRSVRRLPGPWRAGSRGEPAAR